MADAASITIEATVVLSTGKPSEIRSFVQGICSALSAANRAVDDLVQDVKRLQAEVADNEWISKKHEKLKLEHEHQTIAVTAMRAVRDQLGDELAALADERKEMKKRIFTLTQGLQRWQRLAKVRRKHMSRSQKALRDIDHAVEVRELQDQLKQTRRECDWALRKQDRRHTLQVEDLEQERLVLSRRIARMVDDSREVYEVSFTAPSFGGYVSKLYRTRESARAAALRAAEKLPTYVPGSIAYKRNGPVMIRRKGDLCEYILAHIKKLEVLD